MPSVSLSSLSLPFSLFSAFTVQDHGGSAAIKTTDACLCRGRAAERERGEERARARERGEGTGGFFLT